MAQGSKAFLAMPYRQELVWIRGAIATACRRLDVGLVSVDEQVAAGDIVAGIHHHIRASDFGYAVVTGLNPNVIYELGLLHQASKPTIVLSDRETADHLPFDLRSLMMLVYDEVEKSEPRLADQVAGVTAQLLLLFDRAARTAIAGGAKPSATTLAQQIGASTLEMADFDFEAIKTRAANSVNRKGCSTNNIAVVDEGDFKGWRLKARCAGGATLIVRIDLNGQAAEIDVQE